MADIARNIYLQSADLQEVQQHYFNRFGHLFPEIETIDVIGSLGRITSEAVFAKSSSPHYNASAMDGIVVRASDTYAASDSNPVRLKRGAEFLPVDTGDVIPEGFDSVIMIEKVVMIDEETAEIIEAAYPWQDVRPVGEDITIMEMIVPQRMHIRAVDIGAMLAGGVTRVAVFKPLSVAIIPTGTEIVDPGHDLKPGDIIESNSRVFEALLLEKGMVPDRQAIVPDEYDTLRQVLKDAAATHDMVIMNAGSSAGSEDYTRALVAELGEVVYHGINIRPGKPAVMGLIDGKPVIGLPGFPVSAFIVFEEVVSKLIDRIYGQRTHPRTVQAHLSRRVMSSVKNEEFLRVKLGRVADRLIASPLSRGAGVTMSLVRADGVIRIPKQVEGLEAGSPVTVELMEMRGSIDDTLVSIGSHDIILDILTGLISEQGSGTYFTSSHQGSLAGLMALRSNAAHLAPVHLLDEASGDYNTAYVKRYLNPAEFVIIRGLKRMQGLYVAKGNPKGIRGIQDLTREDVVFVNRQRGAGTRVLLDYLLKQEGIDPDRIAGYPREMNTHMTVAASVLSGSADAAMGIASVAELMGLDFIPVGDESYDFVTRRDMLETERMKDFLTALGSEAFRKAVGALAGYTFDRTGEIMEIR